MAFAPKTDFCGLAAASDKITVRDDALNGNIEKYQPQGQDGSFDMGTEVFGEDSAPSNSYGVKAPGVEFTAGKLKLNAVTTVNGKNFALESIEFETAVADADIIYEINGIFLKVPTHLFCIDSGSCNDYAFVFFCIGSVAENGSAGSGEHLSA